MGFRDEPAWKLHDARGLKESPPSSHTLLTQIPGCSMAYRVSIDILHTLDLGVSSRVCGSVLHSWCYKAACNKAQAANNMREVWNSIHEKYKSMKVQERFINLNLAQFTNAETPWAQAPLLKGRAAEVRHLVPVLASLGRKPVPLVASKKAIWLNAYTAWRVFMTLCPLQIFL